MKKASSTARNEAQYSLGRQARQAGYTKESCNLMSGDVGRSFWLAGWHDMDMEMTPGVVFIDD